MKLFVVDPHSIYRQGLCACLEGIDDVTDVADTGTVVEAREHPSWAEADVTIVDIDASNEYEFIRETRATTHAQIVVCTSRNNENDVLASVQAGAVGYLSKDTLTPAAVVAAVRAAANGTGVMAPDLL